MTCSTCGKPFTPSTRKGRPRTRCYECRPARLNQHKRKPVAATAPRKPQTLAEFKDNPHCPYCGAYPDKNSSAFPFCSPRHRQMLAERVQRAASQQKRRKGRLASTDDAGTYAKRKKAAEAA